MGCSVYISTCRYLFSLHISFIRTAICAGRFLANHITREFVGSSFGGSTTSVKNRRLYFTTLRLKLISFDDFLDAFRVKFIAIFNFFTRFVSVCL